MSDERKKLLKNCLVCSSVVESSYLPCECSICLECSYEWIKTQNLETLYLDGHFFNCSNFNCKRQIDVEWIYKNWPIHIVNEINEILIKKYLNGSFIKKCPKTGCNYSGFVESNDKCADSPYICEICQTTWRDKNNSAVKDICNSNENSIYYFIQKLLFLLGIFKSQLLEEISEIRISVLYKSCIHCHRVINKFVGCDHITCVCKKEFCYNCSQDYTDHLNNASRCVMSKGIKGLLRFLFVSNLFFKTVFSFNIFMNIISYTVWIIWLEIFGIGFLVLTGVILFGWVSMIKKRSAICNNNLVKIVSGLLIVIGFYFIYKFYFSYEFFRISMKVIFVEAILVLVFAGCYRIREGYRRKSLLRAI